MSVRRLVFASCDPRPIHPGFEVQLCGMLMRKISKNSNKWKKKFCILRDGYFFVFREDAFVNNPTKSSSIGLPLAPLEILIPVGRTYSEETGDNENPFCFQLSIIDSQESLIFSANHADVLSRWMQGFRDARNITFENLGDWETLITLQEENAEVSRENLRYKELFKTLSNQNEELLRLNSVLDCERMELNKCLYSLEVELENIKNELTETQANMFDLEEERKLLDNKNNSLEEELLKLDTEKNSIAMKLEAAGEIIEDASVTQIKQQLAEISQKSELLQHERDEIHTLLQQKEALSSNLQDERNKFECQANELSTLLKKLETQRTEAIQKLEIEMIARKEAEKKLEDAERALSRLHSNITKDSMNYTRNEKEEMSTDVSKLRKFFEEQINTRTSDSSTSPLRDLHHDEHRIFAAKRDSVRVQMRSQQLRQSVRLSRIVNLPTVEVDEV